MQKTRRQILDILKQRGTATLEELAREIGLSAVTIRAHLSVLERDDLITSEEVRGKVGRPHFVYTLSAQAEEHFPMSYPLVAHRFLESFKAVISADQLGAVVSRVAESWAAEKAQRLNGKSLEERVAEVTRIRTEEGAMACWERSSEGFVVHQQHCPASRIVVQHPEVCQAELQYMEKLLGSPVERTHSSVGGENKCSYRVKA